MAHYIVHFDGSCWPNPNGTAAYGFTVTKEGTIVDSGSGVIATGEGMSNNVAEFFALFKGLESICQNPAFIDIKTVQVLGDSQLVVNIMNRRWKPSKDKLYYPAYLKLDGVTRTIRRAGVYLQFDWIPREQNQNCDDLSKEHNHAIK